MGISLLLAVCIQRFRAKCFDIDQSGEKQLSTLQEPSWLRQRPRWAHKLHFTQSVDAGFGRKFCAISIDLDCKAERWRKIRGPCIYKRMVEIGHVIAVERRRLRE